MNKWEKLSADLNKEEAILSLRNTPDNLAKLHQAGLATIIELESYIAAFGALWPTEDDSFLELGSVWVKKEFRLHKLSSKIFEKLISLIPNNKTVFCITHNTKVIHLLQKYSWHVVSKEEWDLIVPIQLSCGPCDVTSNHKSCKLKAKLDRCAMFIYQNN
ncbi:MAG: hypothetical protein ACPGO5_03735 [Patescibacteria group bacterium]